METAVCTDFTRWCAEIPTVSFFFIRVPLKYFRFVPIRSSRSKLSSPFRTVCDAVTDDDANGTHSCDYWNLHSLPVCPHPKSRRARHSLQRTNVEITARNRHMWMLLRKMGDDRKNWTKANRKIKMDILLVALSLIGERTDARIRW